MSMRITEDCIDCGACEPECPRGAISEGDPHYTIDADKCTECVEEGTSLCVAVCPVECIVKV
jgi:ferredoxin